METGERLHRAQVRDSEVRIRLNEGETYTNRYDRLIMAGRLNRREWEDVKQMIERELLQRLPAAGDGILFGSKKTPGFATELCELQHISLYTFSKALAELHPKFVLFYQGQRKWIVRAE
jgi:hypothetical protein